ncbi:hypothetical protein QF045_001963 [Pseudomonas sp. W4I3]|nr:hypothetical protein [Pseudomonas sp. W4I3]
MLSTQPQACPPVHNSRLAHTALPLPAFRRLARLPSPKTVVRPWKLATCTSTMTDMTVQSGTFKRMAMRSRNARYSIALW